MSNAIPIKIGALWEADVTLTDEDDDPISLVGKTVNCQVITPDDAIAVTDTITNAAGGRVTLTLDDDDTAIIPEGQRSTFRFDVIDASGNVEIRGTAPVRGED